MPSDGSVGPEIEVMRGDGDPAIERIVLHDVRGDQVVVIGAGVVADQDAARVVMHEVVGHDGMMDAAQVDGFAAVEPLTGLEVGRQRGARQGDDPGSGRCPITWLFEIVTSNALVTTMPCALAFCTVKPLTMTWARPAWLKPSTLTPFSRPVASMMVFSGLWPRSDSGFPMTTSSWYVPLATRITSLGAAAATAAPIVVEHPPLPEGSTHSSAA